MSGVGLLAPIYTVRGSKFTWLKVNSYFKTTVSCLRNYRYSSRMFHSYLPSLSKRSWPLKLFPISSYSGAPILTNLRAISKNSNASTNEKIQKALQDQEFQDLLKDFAKDFDVDGENVKILEDIKKDRESGKVQDISDKNKNSGEDATLSAYRSAVKDRYKEFTDRDASIIYSYEEEAQLDLDDDFFHIDKEYETHVEHEAKRGVKGVYDIHELVAVLRDENLLDIAVISIPESYHYVDYMVLANAKSPRHAEAVAEFVVKFYKKKKNKKDPFVKIEGEKLGSWRAIDMGNIVLHIFLEDARVCYDIESLWLLDGKFDSGGQIQTDSFIDFMQEELDILNAITPKETSSDSKELTK